MPGGVGLFRGGGHAWGHARGAPLGQRGHGEQKQDATAHGNAVRQGSVVRKAKEVHHRFLSLAVTSAALAGDISRALR